MVVAGSNLMVEWGGGVMIQPPTLIPPSPPPFTPTPGKKHEELTLRHGMQ